MRGNGYPLLHMKFKAGVKKDLYLPMKKVEYIVKGNVSVSQQSTAAVKRSKFLHTDNSNDVIGNYDKLWPRYGARQEELKCK
jgi:hypothetical protein